MLELDLRGPRATLAAKTPPPFAGARLTTRPRVKRRGMKTRGRLFRIRPERARFRIPPATFPGTEGAGNRGLPGPRGTT